MSPFPRPVATWIPVVVVDRLLDHPVPRHDDPPAPLVDPPVVGVVEHRPPLVVDPLPRDSRAVRPWIMDFPLTMKWRVVERSKM